MIVRVPPAHRGAGLLAGLAISLSPTAGAADGVTLSTVCGPERVSIRELKSRLDGRSFVLQQDGREYRLWVFDAADDVDLRGLPLEDPAAPIDRVEQIFRLAEEADGRVPDALLAVLHDPDRDVREAAVDALGEIGGDAALQHLLRLTQDADPFIRGIAADNVEDLTGLP